MAGMVAPIGPEHCCVPTMQVPSSWVGVRGRGRGWGRDAGAVILG